MEQLKKYFTELASIFGYKYDDKFFSYLKSISVPNTTICGKEIKEGDGGWRCKDCELESNSLYCNDCFIKEKHSGHNISFNPGATGICDCGDHSVLKPKRFCSKHKGDYTNNKDLMNFINSSIDEKLIDKINKVFNKIFLLFSDKIKVTFNKNEENKKNKKKQ